MVARAQSRIQAKPRPRKPAVAKGSTLYQRAQHGYTPRHPTERYHEERQQRHTRHKRGWRQKLSAFDDALALRLTQAFGSMPAVYLFCGIGVGSLIGVFTNNVVLAAICGATSSYFLQLVALPALQKGNLILGRKQEIQSDEMYRTNLRILHDVEQIGKHEDAQDRELLRQSKMLLRLESSVQAIQTLHTMAALSSWQAADGILGILGGKDGAPAKR